MSIIWSDKNKENSICSFFATLAFMGMIGAYYMQNTQTDLSCMNIFIYGSLFWGALYALVYAKKNNERNISTALLGILIISVVSVAENIFGVMGTLNPRKFAEVVNIAFKVLFAFAFLHCVSSGKPLVCRWWYLLITAVCAFVPAVLQALFWINEGWMTRLTGSFTAITYTFFGVTATYALVALLVSVFCLICENKKKNTQNSFVLWSNVFYDISLLMIGVFGGLRGFNEAYVTVYKYGNLVFELSLTLVFLAAVHYNKPVPKRKKKK